jgi:hypothetical protein
VFASLLAYFFEFTLPLLLFLLSYFLSHLRPYPKGSMRDEKINKQSFLPIGGDHDQADVSYAVVFFFFALLYPTLWSVKAKA